MKKITLVCMLVVMNCSLALADWINHFKRDVQALTIGDAVINAMKKGANPAQIIEEGMLQEGLNSVQLVQALFCTGAAGPDVQQAAYDAGISVLAISTAYTKCVAEIGNSGAGTHVYVPVTVTPASTIFSIDDGAMYLSPSAF